jgi:phospholipase C
MRKSLKTVVALGAAGALATAGGAVAATAATTAPLSQPDGGHTGTPIKHLVVIFQENVSFDHYFGTYPNAANTDGQPFHAKPGTPTVNGLTPALLTSNPNTAQPKRLGPAQAVTCDQGHGYTAEQKAFDGGLMDAFMQNTDVESCSPPLFTTPGLVMDYYDGNTVTGLWNYAQRFAMSDNSYGTEFGPSTPGALNLVSGQTGGATPLNADGTVDTAPTSAVVAQNPQHVGTVIGDPDPFLDDCSNHSGATVQLSGPNVGDLLNAQHVTWGWFEGGFAPTATVNGTAVCGSQHKAIDGVAISDYIPHHNPFAYYKSTANVHHVAPASVAEIGRNGPANHNYDLSWFGAALDSGHLPAVSFVKAAAYQDGHAGYSDPLDEQAFLAATINQIEKSRYWHDTAVVISYDDSDGWYDHAMSPILNSSADPAHDALNGAGVCGHGTPLAGIQDRCGYGPRLPLLVISPYAKKNFVDNTITDQTSVLRFIEDNWVGGQRIGGGSFDALAGSLGGMLTFRHPDFRPLILDPATGEPVR